MNSRFVDTLCQYVDMGDRYGANKDESKLPIYLGFDRNEPHNELPPLPPKAIVETILTLKKSIRANRALAELRGVGRLIPNQGMLIRSVALQEAKLSSEIENIVTTNDKLYRAFSDMTMKADPSTKEVLHYEEALWHGYKHVVDGKPLSASLFSEIVSIIRESQIGVRTMPGTQIANEQTGAVIYTPPEGEGKIRDLLDNLSRYLHEDDETDSLIKLAVSHYQFEAIHPFTDGNGRTGRVINILYLVEQNLLEFPVLYLSRYIMENKSGYYNGLRRVTEESAWEEWIIFMLEAIEKTALETRQRIIDIRESLDEAIEAARTRMGAGYRKELVELIYGQPYIRIALLEQVGLAKRQTASKYLSELEQIGLLQSFKFGRERLFVNTRLLQILSR